MLHRFRLSPVCAAVAVLGVFPAARALADSEYRGRVAAPSAQAGAFAFQGPSAEFQYRNTTPRPDAPSPEASAVRSCDEAHARNLKLADSAEERTCVAAIHASCVKGLPIPKCADRQERQSPGIRGVGYGRGPDVLDHLPPYPIPPKLPRRTASPTTKPASPLVQVGNVGNGSSVYIVTNPGDPGQVRAPALPSPARGVGPQTLYTPAAPSHAAVPPARATRVRFQSVRTGPQGCLTVADGGPVISPCDGSTEQTFAVPFLSDGQSFLLSPKGGRCLSQDAAGHATFVPCNAGVPAQHWSYNGAGELVSVAGRPLSLPSSAPAMAAVSLVGTTAWWFEPK